MVGFDKLDSIPAADVENLFKLRDNEIKDMLELQFMLAYKVGISKADTDNMTIFELQNWFNLLKERVRIEEESSNKPQG